MSHPAPIKVPLLDLPRAHEVLAEELREAFERVLTSGRFVLGPEVDAFEAEMASYLGIDRAIAVSSGTDALIAALMALDIGPGDEVLCPGFSFFATASSIARVGAVPVFADVCPHSFNSCAKDFESLISERCRAILVVHLFGRCAEMDSILELAKQHQLPVIEDAAQALGSTDGEVFAGTMGVVGCFSFFPTKNLGGLGEGGLLCTNDAALADRLRSLRSHGESRKYHHAELGGNFRMDALQAALLRVKLPHLDDYNGKRRTNATLYQELLLETGLCTIAPEAVENIPIELSDASHVGHIFHQYVLRVKPTAARGALRDHLLQAGVQSEVYYPKALHLQACFAHLDAQQGDLPVAERLATEVLALPICPETNDGQIRYVVDAIADFFRRRQPS